jgi:hypothetical protein
VVCPAAGERTMVALVFGQSQAANVVREQFVGGGHVFNYFRAAATRQPIPCWAPAAMAETSGP